MRKCTFFWVVFVILAFHAGPLTGAQADVVGHITQVEGRVDLLKGGKLPATPVALQDKVESGDVLRTKSLSKTQITFIDNSVITLSPESRLAVDEYKFEPAQQKRNAVLNLFQGMAHVLVNKIIKVEEPDFVIKTHTAVLGVRGTDFGILLQPNASTVLNFHGVTQVANIFPEVGQLDRRAFKAAFAFPSANSPHSVLLQAMQGTTVGRGLPPTLPFSITAEDQKEFLNRLSFGVLGRQRGQGSGSGTGGTGTAATVGGTEFMTNLGGPDSGLGIPASSGTTSPSVPAGLTTGTGDTSVTLLNIVTVPPTVLPITPITPTPTPSTFSFTQQYYGAWMTLATAPYSQSTLLGYSWGQRTGVYDGYFYSTTNATRTSPEGVTGFYPSLATGSSMGTATGSVTGFLGQTLTGTMTYNGTNSLGDTIIRIGTVTILPTGELTYNWTDTVSAGSVPKGTGVGTSTQTPGTYFSQTATGQANGTANLAGNQLTATNSGDLTGTRVENGITTSFRAGFSATVTAPNANTFTSSPPTSNNVTSSGVLGPPDAAGVRTGVMTSNGIAGTSSYVTGGPVRYVPSTSSTPAAMFATVMGTPPGIPSATSVGMWAQTSDPSAQIITQTHEGSFTVTSSPPNTTGTLNGTGWGFRTEFASLIPVVGPTTATLNVTSGGTLGSNPELLNQTLAAVVLPSGSSRVGPAQGIGIASGDSVVSTTGTVTADAVQNLTYNFNGTWVSPDNRGTLTSGVQTMAPGAYFTQTTNTGTGSVTHAAPYTTAPFTQLDGLGGDMTRTGVAPASNQGLSGTITSVTNVSGALPPAGTVPATINMQGVVTPGQTIQSGNMTMTTHQAPGMPVSTYMGPVSIDTLNNTLNANVVGRNHAYPGVNRVPARQTGTVVSTPPGG